MVRQGSAETREGSFRSAEVRLGSLRFCKVSFGVSQGSLKVSHVSQGICRSLRFCGFRRLSSFLLGSVRFLEVRQSSTKAR